MVEILLACGYIKRDQYLAESVIENLARLGRLDLMQQVVLLHSPYIESRPLSIYTWWSAIKSAGKNGYLPMLFDHPMGQEFRIRLKLQRNTNLVLLAACIGHVGILPYLYEQGAADEIKRDRNKVRYSLILMLTMHDDHCDTVRWMIENTRFPETGRLGGEFIGVATQCRRFDILKFLHELASSGMTPNDGNHSDQVPAWWSLPQNVMDVAGGSGRIDVFRCLLSNHPREATEAAMDRAACGGHLEMIQWLHVNRSEEKAMDYEAANGHVDVVWWLHANRSEGCTTEAMDGAACRGHLEIVK